MASVLIIQHFAADAPYDLDRHFQGRRIDQKLVRLHEGERLPGSLRGYDGLLVLGGPDSAAQEGPGFPTLAAEIALVTEAHNGDVPALGICLGAQIMARAAGARVYPGPRGKEIGWLPLRFTPAGQKYFGLDDAEATALQWHGDTFDVPPDAELLASSDMYAQVFCWGSCLAVQAHFEVGTTEAIDSFIAAFPGEADLAPGGIERMRCVDGGLFRETEQVRASVTNKFLDAVEARAVETS